MTDLPGRFSASNAHLAAVHRLIPGGAHTYAKGDDQYPEGLAPVITRGEGCRVWDLDGNCFVEYGNGLKFDEAMVQRIFGAPPEGAMLTFEPATVGAPLT